MTGDPNNDEDPKQLALETVAVAMHFIPLIGGAVGAVLSGVGTARRIKRVREVIDQLAGRVDELKSEVTEQYVRTEDFEELLERTLRMAADERNEDKRRLYAAFLVDDMKAPQQKYEEKLHVLKTLEQVQLDHLAVLRAVSLPPEPNPGMMGSPVETLVRRLPGMTEGQISELAAQLNGLGLAKLPGLVVMMTGAGAADLRGCVTPYGERFLRYLADAQA